MYEQILFFVLIINMVKIKYQEFQKVFNFMLLNFICGSNHKGKEKKKKMCNVTSLESKGEKYFRDVFGLFFFVFFVLFCGKMFEHLCKILCNSRIS